MCTDLADADTMHDGRDDHYLAVGLSALACVESALHGRTPQTILDLPCGFGRVTRVLRARYPSAEITVCDLDRPGVDFAARHFGARPVYSVDDFAELRLDRPFDLIWVGSLVTHLSEAQTGVFLGRMAASLAPGGTLVVSSHGPSVATGLKDWGYGLEPGAVAGVLDGYRDHGYGHRGYGGGSGYGISMTDQEWWEQAVGALGLRLVSYGVRDWDGHQDIVVLERLSDAQDPAPRSARAPGASGQAVRQDRAAIAAYDPVLARFDAAFYLAAYPDVAAAVAAGTIGSAFEHFRSFGRREGRISAADPLG